MTVLTSTVFAEAPAVGRPTLLRLADSLLWVADAAADPGLHVFNLNTGALLHSIGRQGEGPGEFASRPFSLDADPPGNGAVWAFDRELQRLTRFEPRALGSYEFQVIRLQSEPVVQRVAWLNSNRIVGQSNSVDARFTLFSQAGERVTKVKGMLVGPDTVAEGLRLNLTNNAIKLCPWPGRGFAIANFMLSRIEFYDTTAQMMRLAEVPFEVEARVELNESGNLQWHLPRRWYFDCAAARSKLIALFSGRLQAAYGVDARSSGTFLHVFDWDGKLIKVYRLDHDIRSIAVNQAGDTIYAGSLVDARIYRFVIPGEGG